MYQQQLIHLPLRHDVSLLTHYLKPLRWQIGWLALLIFTGIGLQLVNPWLIRSFIDSAMAGGALRELWFTAGVYIAITLFYQGLAIAQTYLAEKSAWQATNRLRTDLTRHCLQLDISFHNAHTPGELIERLDGDVAALANFFSQFALIVVANSLLLLGILLVLFWEDWRIGLPILLFVLGALLTTHVVRDLAAPRWHAARESLARLMGFLEERLAGTEDIRANGATAYMMLGLHRRQRDRFQTFLRAYMTMVATFTTMLGLVALGNVIALSVGAYLLGLNMITIGTVYLIFHYTRLLVQPLQTLLDQLNDLQQSAASLTRIKELFGLQSAMIAGTMTLPPGPLSVEFQHVSFRYASEPTNQLTNQPTDLTIRDLSFRLPPGAVLGLAGRTGSGKSTLTRLISRLYDPSAGVIRLGEVDIRQVDPVALRQKIGLVTQDVQLFQATVRDNLTFFDKDISDERILEALRTLALWDWFNTLPNGLDTELAAGGKGLSAGEAQLLAFTRVLLKDPALVILDEASSRLDPLTERLIHQAVTKLLDNGQRTGIIIAHRLETLQQVDKILILEDGACAEYESREQLANDPTSRFYQLLQVNAGRSAELEEVLA